MYKKYSIEQLTENTVNIEIRTYADIEGQEYLLRTEGKCYANSPIGREQVEEELPGNISAAIFAVWGDTPSVEDPEMPEVIKNE